MASSGRTTGVHIAMIIGWMFAVIFIVAFFIGRSDYSELAAENAKKTEELTAAETDRRNLDEDVQALKDVLGVPLDEVGVGDEDNVNTAIGKARADMNRFGGNLRQGTAIATIIKLREELNNREAELAKLQTELDQRKATLLALQANTAEQIKQHTDAHDKTDADLKALAATKDEELKAKDRQINDLRTSVNDLQQDLTREQDLRSQEQKSATQRIAQLSTINDELRSRVDELLKVSFEVPDGVIRSVDHINKLVWINLGEADNLSERTTFAVYTKGHQGVARGEEDIKGAIEVTHIVGPHLAQARVLDQDIYRPIASDDPIYTALWSPGRQERFSVVGLIDLDADGQYDRPQFHDLVTASGSIIDNEVDDEGVRHGDGIDVHTKFLIVGEIPSPTDTTIQEEKDIYQKIIDGHQEMVEEARLRGTRILSLNDFLSYIGYRPQRRLYRPGENRPYNLHQGAHSTATTGYGPGNRQSSGQVSGLFSRRRPLKKQDEASTGATSGAYSSER